MQDIFVYFYLDVLVLLLKRRTGVPCACKEDEACPTVNKGINKWKGGLRSVKCRSPGVCKDDC